MPVAPNTPWELEIVVFFGEMTLYAGNMTKELYREASEIDSFPDSTFRVGEPDVVYYTMVVNPNVKPSRQIWRDNTRVWHEIQGVEVSEKQYESMMCDFDLPQCSNFLNRNTPGLTPEQLKYVNQHPITKDDLQGIYDRFDEVVSWGNPYR